MTVQAKRMVGLLVALVAVTITLAGTSQALAANPVKLVLAGQIGWEVNTATKGTACQVASGVCRDGRESSEPGGFLYPEGIAAAGGEDFYVADKGNHRVQELNAAGEFVLMFGKDVNTTTGGNVCTEEEIKKTGVKCAAGTSGGEPGQFGEPQSVAVDPLSGNVYVAERLIVKEASGERVQEFTAGGKFVLEIGKEVNQTTKGDLCTQLEAEKGVTCGPPAQEAFGSRTQRGESGAFDFPEERGDVLAVGGEHDLLYVAEEGRVQEFEADGKPAGEIPLSGGAIAVAVAASGVYVAALGSNILQEFNNEGGELGRLEVIPAEAEEAVGILAVAVDSAGHIALSTEAGGRAFGVLYEGLGGARLPGFTISAAAKAISFDAADGLYAVNIEGQEVYSYTSEVVAGLRTAATTCKEGAARSTSVTFDCSLKGEVNPYAVADTHAWFEWGRTCALGSQTPSEGLASVEAILPVSAVVEGLRPNEAFCDRVAGGDENVQLPEELTGASVSFDTPAVPPKIVGVPSASFVGSSSAVLYGELNPENANSEYFFEYVPEAKPGEDALAACPGVKVDAARCSGVAVSTSSESALYGQMGATLSASGLQPSTTYRYRLAVSNAAGQSIGTGPGQEAAFTTAAAPVPTATTGGPSSIGATSATVSGTVDSDGQPATYMFELGIYQGAATRYGVVFSGSAGASTSPTVETLGLTGLQPGSTYAYRIAVKSGYTPAGEPVFGEPVLFTTEGLPAVLNSPATPPLLTIPNIAFPKPTATPKAKPKQKTKVSKRKRRKTKRKTRGSSKAKQRQRSHTG